MIVILGAIVNRAAEKIQLLYDSEKEKAEKTQPVGEF